MLRNIQRLSKKTHSACGRRTLAIDGTVVLKPAADYRLRLMVSLNGIMCTPMRWAHSTYYIRTYSLQPLQRVEYFFTNILAAHRLSKSAAPKVTERIDDLFDLAQGIVLLLLHFCDLTLEAFACILDAGVDSLEGVRFPGSGAYELRGVSKYSRPCSPGNTSSSIWRANGSSPATLASSTWRRSNA